MSAMAQQENWEQKGGWAFDGAANLYIPFKRPLEGEQEMMVSIILCW